MRTLAIILALSILAFGAWLMLRPDPRAGEELVEEQMTAMPDTSEDMVAEADEAASDDAALSTSTEDMAEEETDAAMATDEEPEPEVQTFATNEAEIVSLFENASWVSAGRDGPVLYVVTFRTCPTCLAFKEAEQQTLVDAGVDVRWIIYARRDREGRERSTTEERAVQAELWLNRDWHLFQDWYYSDPDTYYATTELPPLADEDPVRAAAVEEGRAFVDRLAELYEEDGADLFIPALLWEQDGEWKSYVGYTETSFAPVREFLTSH